MRRSGVCPSVRPSVCPSRPAFTQTDSPEGSTDAHVPDREYDGRMRLYSFHLFKGHGHRIMIEVCYRYDCLGF